MTTSSSRPYLRIVKLHDTAQKSPHRDSEMPTKQPMLFSDASTYTLGFIKAGDLDGERLINLINEAKPRLIFDLRPAPRFARGSISRRVIFSLFEKNEVEYFDVAGVLGVATTRDSLLNPALLIDAIQITFLRNRKDLYGPVFFFVEEELFNEKFFNGISDRLPHQDGRGWDVTCWPNEPNPTTERIRDLVFISHANPADNDIATWFSTRLAAHGYKVWSDVTRLIGGEMFWDTIEQAIRQQSAKVIVLLSKQGHEKPGLLDEVNLAVMTERAEGLERFVIPIRVDDLPFTLVRANLARRNIIDGSENLAGALRAILKILSDDDVPQCKADLRIKDWTSSETIPSFDNQWDTLFENCIKITNCPNVIRRFRNSSNSSSAPFVSQPVSGGSVTFENWENLSNFFDGQVQRAGEALFSLREWTSTNELVFSDQREMRQALSAIVQQAWDRYCKSIGLSDYHLANRRLCWFLPVDVLTSNRIRYVDYLGKQRTKNLVGRSPRRGVYWHFAVEARPDMLERSVRLIPHVLFSSDGKVPFFDPDVQHALRRGFCRNWWNARWRDLLIAFLTFMSRGTGDIRLPVSSVEYIEVSAHLKMYESIKIDSISSTDVRNDETQLISFAEPRVAVGYDQTTDYPKEGLLQFGPVSFHRNPATIRVGLVGTPYGIELFQRWSKQFNTFRRAEFDVRNSLPFPGFEAVFGANWPNDPVRTVVLSRTDVVNSILLQDRHQAVYRTCDLYVASISDAITRDDVNVDVWYVIIPDEVYVYGRPKSRVPRTISIATPNAMGRLTAKRFTEESPSLFAEDNVEALIYDYHLNFHNQLKERLLAVQAVTQILRESSLTTVTSSVVENPKLDSVGHGNNEPHSNITGWHIGISEFDFEEREYDPRDNSAQPNSEPVASGVKSPLRRQMQDPAAFSWNLGTTTFFKAGGRPWRVAAAREGVCYIGLIFKQDIFHTRQACCGAQMFLDDSDGLVFKGAMGPWYSPKTGQFHLDRSEAKRLLKMVVNEYENQHGKMPKEIFIHGKTRFDKMEWLGFCDALDLSSTKLTAVRITRSGEFKLYSSGELAVKRGTALKINSHLGYLWTSGYISRLRTYPGRETPNPLRIEIIRDSSKTLNIELVMQDILALTKMNFNACIYADGVPVTLRFADAIGDVLVAAKNRSVPPLPFRHYI